MIALCSNHAAKADQNYYPDDYLRKLKANGTGRTKSVEGEFDYLRRDLVVVVGSNAYYNVDTILEVGGRRAVFFNRDDEGYLLLNFQIPGAMGQPRAWMEDNVWLVPPGAENIECPPRGRFLDVRFDNGDRFKIEYTEFDGPKRFRKTYPQFSNLIPWVKFPLTVAEFWEKAEGAGIELGRGVTRVGNMSLQGSTVINAHVGIAVTDDGSVGIASGQASPAGRLSKNTQESIASALESFYQGRV